MNSPKKSEFENSIERAKNHIHWILKAHLLVFLFYNNQIETLVYRLQSREVLGLSRHSQTTSRNQTVASPVHIGRYNDLGKQPVFPARKIVRAKWRTGLELSVKEISARAMN